MWGNKALPEFGCLSGVKVLHATQALAGPFGAMILAEYGADVLWLENAAAPDTMRLSQRAGFQSERRNQRTLTLNIPTEEGREVFARLIAGADVFIENGKGGQYDNWGLSDEALWEINPRLVIAHVSGFGQTGVPDYVQRPAYDPIAQAFSGYTHANGSPGAPPFPAPSTADYVAALYQVIGILAALHKVRDTGQGEAIDVAMFECMMKLNCDQSEVFTRHQPVTRMGEIHWISGWGTYRCMDGEYLQLCLLSGGVLKRALNLLDLPYGSEEFPQGTALIRNGTPAAKTFTAAIERYLSSRTASEAEREMLAAGLPVARVNDLKDLENDPHVLARGTLDEWEAFNGERIKSVGVVPKFKRNPGRTWRPAPTHGMDNEDVLREIGLTEAQIRALYDKGVIVKDQA